MTSVKLSSFCDVGGVNCRDTKQWFVLMGLGYSIRIPHTHCVRFKKHLAQGGVSISSRLAYLALLNKIFTPSEINLILKITEIRCI